MKLSSCRSERLQGVSCCLWFKAGAFGEVCSWQLSLFSGFMWIPFSSPFCKVQVRLCPGSDHWSPWMYGRGKVHGFVGTVSN